MISVLPENSKEKVKELFALKSIEWNENAGAVVARSNDGVLGFCLYYLDSSGITVLEIEPKEDLMLLDGILRSALHIAAERFVLDARYSDTLDSSYFKKLGFILDENEKRLDIDKLFKGCACKCGQTQT